jgi:ankyrin repeat protein
MLALGIDVYAAIEIADNAGRTPLFEAVENLNDQDEQITTRLHLLTIILKNKALNGFGANPNVIDYNGHTPVFIAAR